MEKATKSLLTNTKINTEPMSKFRKDVDMMERDIRRTGNLLHSDAIWELANETNYTQTVAMLKESLKHLNELVDWVEIHEKTLTKKKAEGQPESA